MTNQNKTEQKKGEHKTRVRPLCHSVARCLNKWLGLWTKWMERWKERCPCSYYIFHPDHVWLVGLTLLFLKFLTAILSTLSFLNPVERSLENFRMTDVFYDIYRSGEQTDTTDLITIVDITDVFDRGRLAETLMEICY